MTDESLRQEQHLVEKGIFCPSCGAKDSIVFQHPAGKTRALDGSLHEEWSSCKPYCFRCKKSFSKGTMFRKGRV